MSEKVIKESMSSIFEFNNSQYTVLDHSQSLLMTEEERRVVDGKHIIGRVVGPMFVPDGASRNDRWYPKELWENVLKDPEVQTRLESRLVFGSIGHDDQPFSDADLRNGLASHITTRLWIDENTGLGMGESLILGTQTGQTLLTTLKAGSKLHVSSRAFGEYKANEYHDGMPVVDPDTYQFHCFDWVIDPGFLQARPTLKEKKEEDFQHKSSDMENKETFNEALSVLKEAKTLAESKVVSLTEENENLKQKNEALRKEANRVIAGYRALLGDVNAVQEAIKKSGAKSVSELAEAFKLPNAKELIKFLSGKKMKLETLQGIESLISTKNEGMSSLANAHRLLKAKLEKKDAVINKAKALIESYQKYGSLEELEDTYTVLEKYTTLGSIPDITRVLSICSEKYKKVRAREVNSIVEALAKKSGVEVETVASLIKKVGVTEARSILGQLKKPIVEKKKPVVENKVIEKGEAKSSIFEKYSVNNLTKAPVKEAKEEVKAEVPLFERYAVKK